MRTPQQDAHEQAVQSPELAALVAAARELELPPLRVNADAIYQGFRAQRARTRTRVIGGLALAASLALAWSLGARGQDRDATVVAERVEAPAVAVAVEEVAPVEAAPQLIAAATVTPEGDATFEVLAPRRIRLHDGVFAITFTGDLAAGDPDATFEVLAGDQTMILRAGSARVTVAGHHSEAALERGAAEWIREGKRTKLVPPDPRGPEALAAEAERQLAAGERDAAIDLLLALVRSYPAAPESRTALVDLGALLAAEGRKPEAYCAYHYYLERVPQSPVRADVTRALAKLAPTDCDEFTPR